jgi:preprotein translocase subunit Sec63
MKKDYYDVLGVSKNSSNDEIKKRRGGKNMKGNKCFLKVAVVGIIFTKAKPPVG